MPTEEKVAERQLCSGVTLSWLKEFARQHNCASKKAYVVLTQIIKPLTRRHRCRFVELPDVVKEAGIARAQFFFSPVWEEPISQVPVRAITI